MDREQISFLIKQWVKTHREEAVSLVRELVMIPSVNHPPRGDEAACQQFIAQWLEREGADVRTYELSEVAGLERHPAYMYGRQYEGRPNVTGLFRGTGSGSGGRSIVFSSHIDTVYEGKEAWSHPPFAGEIEGGKLYGRGAYDMKGGLAASLMSVKCLKEIGVPLRADVCIESVVDEEHGGANGTLAARLSGVSADMAIIPEPTNLQMCPAHVGGGIWKASFTGKSGIGFAGEELVSALEATVSFANLLTEFRGHWNRLNNRPELWETSGRCLEVMLLSIVSGDTDRELQEKLPSTGELSFWIEGYPGMTGERIMEELWAFYDRKAADYPLLERCRPAIVPLIRYLEASEMKQDERTKAFLERAALAGKRALGRDPGPVRGAPFACDGFMFNLYSETPALILGPSGGNAHAADEFLDLESYFGLIRWYAELMVDWCEGNDGHVT